MAKTTKTTTATTKPDIVYPLAFLYDYNELRYSLRSLKNLPHGRVFIGGYAPDWLANSTYIFVDKPLDMNRKNHEIGNIYAVLANLKAVMDDEVSDDFILMNDDFYILNPLDELPVLHRGPIENVIAEYKAAGAKAYLKTMERTRDFLLEQGYTDILSYELHTPMRMNKQKWLKMYDLYQEYPELHPLHTRTIYGNVYQVGGTEIQDVKVYDNDTRLDTSADFVSTENTVFNKGKVGQDIKELFTEPSEYELE
jgi:hypothetical protein